MRKFLTASLTAATLAGGALVPAANADIVDDVNSLSCKSTKQIVESIGATTKGELIVLLDRKSISELKGLLLLAGEFALTEKNKSPLIEQFAAKAEKCNAVEQGLLAETSSLFSNTSSVANKKLSSDEDKDKDKKNFDFSDIFTAFSSGISS
ncbi:hypothetical protein ACFSSC_07785 [Corynebacterium mendelii]|uniref:Secreted protein n=1 Tax=Corynebacterium mendelii TaxID=2765362 RepID=A0A939IVZ8_9CORY|nr:hypothetical protein [Corynebacterium mendelii]MBN9644766.1 hypothetical protein [Corynebacterium mendelii]